MANNHFLANIYIVQPPLSPQSYVGGTNGISNSFPSAGTRFYPADSGVTANGVTMASVIELLPTGLNVHSFKFWTDKSITDLNTEAT